MLNACEIQQVLSILRETYPDAAPQLDFGNAYQLLAAVILSAQCTDRQVNKVTPALFARFPSPEDLAGADVQEVETLIKSCGFYHTKARHLIDTCKAICSEFGGQVPSTLEELRTLPGVGRKTANVVYACAFHGDAIAVDTHVFRVTNRIGLAHASDVEKTEFQLMENIPKDLWSLSHHLLIFHGRRICHAQRKDCGHCPLTGLCETYLRENGGSETAGQAKEEKQ
ncbi:MAG: endonuclease III [Clostridia bacterium]|nr:endonuclease III [Clostridia bacterium]